jgi:hypothetical protein
MRLVKNTWGMPKLDTQSNPCSPSMERLSMRDMDKEMEDIKIMVTRLCMEDTMAGTITLVDDDVMMESDTRGTTLCEELLENTIEAAVTRSRERVSVWILNEEVMDNAWTTLEHHRIMEIIEYMGLSSVVEKQLREARELVEAEQSFLLKQEQRRRRQERVEELKELWKKKKKEKEVSEMVDMLGKLSLDELARDVEELEDMIANMVLEESNHPRPGGRKRWTC